MSAQVTPETRAELERRAAQGDRTLSSELRRAIRLYLERADRDEEEAP